MKSLLAAAVVVALAAGSTGAGQALVVCDAKGPGTRATLPAHRVSVDVPRGWYMTYKRINGVVDPVTLFTATTFPLRARPQSSGLCSRGLQRAWRQDGAYVQVTEERDGASRKRMLRRVQKRPASFQARRAWGGRLVHAREQRAAHVPGGRTRVLRLLWLRAEGVGDEAGRRTDAPPEPANRASEPQVTPQCQSASRVSAHEDAGSPAAMAPRVLSLLVGVAVAVPASAAASVTVTTNAQRPALRVDTRGYAEVSWTARGVRRTLLIPPRGRAFPGGRLPGRDVSSAAPAVKIPFRRVVRRTPDGRYWALQSWRLVRGGTVELRFSRWRGAPTVMELATEPSGGTELLRGRATFHGRPIAGFWQTLEGARIRLAAAFECFACMGRPGWQWFGGKRTQSNGTFASTVPLRARARQYRATIVGPNIGTTLAPDASAVAASSLGP